MKAAVKLAGVVVHKRKLLSRTHKKQQNATRVGVLGLDSTLWDDDLEEYERRHGGGGAKSY